MIILKSSDIPKVLPMRAAIEAMKEAFAALSSGQAEVPLRCQLAIEPYNGTSIFMPAFIHYEEREALAIKVVSVYPENAPRDLPIIHAAVLVLEAQSGRPIALLEGGRLTAIRTGAASGAATDLLARPDSHIAAIFGAGVQGRTQLEAICTVRPIEKVWVFDTNQDKVHNFIADMAGQGSIPEDLRAASSSQEAVAEADIICTATTSNIPVFQHNDLKPGIHINGVGSFTQEMQEIPPETVKDALVVVDSLTAAFEEAGDLIQAIQAGVITPDHIRTELGEIVLGEKLGRTSNQETTFFKSVGVAVQDALAARIALRNALEMGVGQRVAW
jgi:alanine dehydrogenase